ncbi:DUF1071 domain-containing protein [Dyadobacter sp. CY323]|uniref:Sak single strand annealing protein n=1 Tax=Dyadobacter sp. CY323 TaxID=2907302 RepID=UPI001F2173C8|nr:DUF1071 domain-containing protein [Dyadobacter sp. CY323]MCE6993103.1 DUF1071 domain-containing protein [Dyadobacter sp. CY323]
MSEPVKNSYSEIRAINVNEHTEKKGKLTYLSWAWAVDILMQRDENASWEYDEHKVFPDDTMMVFCTVEAFGRKRKMQLPVMDNMNKPIKNPNSFQVNTAMQRCLAKAIALHGLGLYIYAGEDLPDGEEVPEKKQEQLSKDNRDSILDSWPIDEQAKFYRTSLGFFHSDDVLTVDVLNEWYDKNSSWVRNLSDDRQRGDLISVFRDSLATAAVLEMDAMDGLQNLIDYWKSHSPKFSKRLSKEAYEQVTTHYNTHPLKG